MKILNRVLFLLFCLNNANWVSGKVIHGDLWTGDNWHFLARFCFLSLHGKFDYEVQVSYFNHLVEHKDTCEQLLEIGVLLLILDVFYKV